MNLKKFTPIIAKCFQGQTKLGVEEGGIFLYNNLFYEKTRKKNISIEKKEFDTQVGYEKLYKTCATTNHPLVLGGDHSIGASSVFASIKKYGSNTTVIWIDAHADINTHESSITKNTHGMPLAYATGLEKCDYIKMFDEEYNYSKSNDIISFNKIIYVGIRDLDQFEKDIISRYNIKHYTPQQTIEYINTTSDVIHISFDVDALDPSELNSTGTIAENGLKYLDVKNIINHSVKKDNLIALDIVEFNPKLGDVKKSLETIKKIFTNNNQFTDFSNILPFYINDPTNHKKVNIFNKYII